MQDVREEYRKKLKTAEEAEIPVQKIRHGRLLMLLSRRYGQIWRTTEPTPIKVMD